MRFLRTNTAIRLTVGPFLDKTDGITPETAITVTSCKLTLMVDDANVPTLVLDTAPTASGGANDMVHVTNDDAGFYDLELAAANVNYLGRAMLAITDAAVHCPVFHEFMILPAVVYDAMVLGTDLFDVSMTQILGTAVSTPATAGILDVNVKNIDNDAASASGTVTFPNATLASTTNITAGTITTVTTVTNQLTAAAIATGVWQDATAGDFTVASSIGKALYISNVAPGASGGHMISGSNAGTTTFGAFTVTGATTFTGAVTGTSGSNDLRINGIVPGAANGLFIAGTNAATVVTTSLTTTFTGDLTGSVGSVTGAVGSVTGSVGGNVTGSVGSVASGGITAASIATGAIDADAIASDAITAAKIAADAITDAKVASDVTIASVTGAVGSVTGAVGSVTATVNANAIQISGDTTAADNIELAYENGLPFLIGQVADSVSPTTTAFETDTAALTTQANDFFNNGLITFISGALRGITCRITDYDAATNVFTVSTLPAAPANDVWFVLVGRQTA